MGAFTAWWSSARFGWGRVWSSASVSTEPFPALPSSGKSTRYQTPPGGVMACAPLLGEVGDAARVLVRRGPRARHLTREHVC